jgi:hypothetical protein
MRPIRAGGLGGLALIAALLVSGAGHTPLAALADGDPASDILLFSDFSLPYSAPVSEVQKTRLMDVVKKAKRAHYPIKVAIIASALDLGTDDRFTGHPSGYARFLSKELTSPTSYKNAKHNPEVAQAADIKVPILVVMSDGIALAKRGRLLQSSVVGKPEVPARPGADPLTEQAVIAIKRLAARAGHPLRGIGPSPAATGSGKPVSTQTIPSGSSSSSSDGSALSGWAIAGIVAIALLALAAIGVVVTRLSRRRSANGP